MAHLSLSLLGPFQVTLDGAPVTAFESDKVRALLAYLAVEADRPQSRDKLAGLLWPNRTDRDARSNLRYALSNLRKAIGDRPTVDDRAAAPPFLRVSRQTIQFNGDSESWVDVTAFANLLESPTPTVRELEEAVYLYRGEFLEGFSLGDSVPFEEWVLFKREYMCRRLLYALHRLAATYERSGEYERALPYAWRQVELEPWQEKTQRQLMRLLALNGQRGAALAQYEACRRALAEELDVEPAPETTRLYAQIRDGGADFGQVRDQVEARQVAPMPSTSLPPAQARPSGRRIIGLRLALIGSGLLLLVVAIMQAIMFLGIASPEKSVPSPGNIVAPPEGKIVRLCEDLRLPQICVYETHTGQLVQVTDDLEFSEVDGLAWSPDGRQIVFDADSAHGSTQPRDHDLYVINADGTDLRQLTGGETSDRIPVWSPDGEWIAFIRDGKLWIVRPDGSEPRRLFRELDEPCVGDLTWSPNSRHIAFVVHECTPAFLPKEVWVVNGDGTEPRMLHAFKRQLDYANVYWDRDGRGIVCVQLYGGEEIGLLLISADGIGEPYLIDEVPFWWAANYWPQWRREQ